MKKFLKNCKGAVTVIVTLLLIPSILVSGTGVDLARIYVARSTLQDANQLALNSTLANYDALLQDLYGLYGVMVDDPELADMVDRYIRLTVFTEDGVDSTDTFQLFYGANLEPGNLEAVPNQNLGNPDVLRRQIEEYSKFRAPVIIINEILDRLNNFKQAKADADIIQDKLDIEDGIEELDELYKKIYNCIKAVDRAEADELSALGTVNECLNSISDELSYAYRARELYTQAYDDEDEDLQKAYEDKFNQHLDNLKSLISGGTVRSGWYLDEENQGHWSSAETARGIDRILRDARLLLYDYIDSAPPMATNSLYYLLDLCKQADTKREALNVKINELEAKVNSGNCSETLKKGMSDVIAEYRKLVNYNLEAMAQAVIDKDAPQIQRVIDLLKEERFADVSFDFLKIQNDDSFQVGFLIGLRTLTWQENVPDKLHDLANASASEYQRHRNEGDVFHRFEEQIFSTTHNPDFYEMLVRMYGDEAGEHEETPAKKRSLLGNTLNLIHQRFLSFWEFEPEGAKSYTGSGTAGPSGVESDFGSTGDWSDADEIRGVAKDNLNGDLLSMLGNAADAAADKLLLLTYDSEMFSCYSTNKRSDDDVEVSMSGIPLGTKVNYYYQSELEYLFHGDGKDAISNLKTITCMIFLVRFVFNYVASFSIQAVNSAVTDTETALSWAGPAAIVVGELVRLVLALGESVCDVSRLKNGCQIALVKDNKTWTFSIEGVLSAFENAGKIDDDPAEKLRMTYKDYLRVFLLFVDGNTLALRTSKLIELNVTNYRDGIDADEGAMAGAELFDLAKAVTDFRLTTTVDLRMLFLSMPFAQKGINGVIPPKTFPISATDYRGY